MTPTNPSPERSNADVAPTRSANPLRLCRECKEKKSLEKFSFDRGVRRRLCKTCASKAQPDTTNPKDLVGSKKPSMSFVPSGLLLAVSKVMQLGAKKYGAMNFRETPVRWTVYYDAAMRHLFQAIDGEEIDPESGQSHVAHAAASLGILLDAQASGTLIDDRPPKGPASKLIRKFTKS